MSQAIAALALGMALLVSGCSGREQRLTEQGNALVERIDAFQKATHRLPENLGELGLEDRMEGPLYYQKVSTDHYIVSFGTTVGHSMIYRSDRRTWDDH